MTAQPTFSPAPQAAGPRPAPKRRAGRVVAVVISALVVLAGLGVGALFLFGTKTVDTASVQQEIDRITRSAVEVAPADVRCPVGIEAQAGGTFTCTAMVDGQPVTYWVHQNDDQGNLTVTYDRSSGSTPSRRASPTRSLRPSTSPSPSTAAPPTAPSWSTPPASPSPAPRPTRPARPTAHS